MKYKVGFVALILMLSSVLHAQITLEHEYPHGSDVNDIAAVDSAEEYYVGFDQFFPIHLYKLDHTLYKTIPVPSSINLNQSMPCRVFYITRKLFDLDDKLEFMVIGNARNADYTVTLVLNEEGEVKLECDTCSLPFNIGFWRYDTYPSTLFQTSRGTKLLLSYFDSSTRVYSLPGKLPNTNHSGVLPNRIEMSGSSTVGNAYPNPSTGTVSVAYILPEGATTGELVITDLRGVELHSYKIGNMFSDILIPRAELPTGMYLYRIVTSKGESRAKTLVIER